MVVLSSVAVVGESVVWAACSEIVVEIVVAVRMLWGQVGRNVVLGDVVLLVAELDTETSVVVWAVVAVEC